MTSKQTRRFYCILLISTFLWNQQTPFFTQKSALENSYHDKVVATLSRLVGRENFIAIINVEFSNSNSNLNKKSSSSQPTTQKTPNGYSPIPGLPTVPSQNNALTENSTNRRRSSENNYYVNKIIVNIELDENLFSESIEGEIISLIKKAIPEIKECDDCIKIDTIQFLPSEKSNLEKQLEELQKTVAALQSNNKLLEDEKRKSDLAKEEKNYAEIQKKLDETLKAEEKKYADVQKQLTFFEEREIRERRIREERDSIRFLIALEDEKRNKEQLLKEKEESEKKVERMMNSKIRSDSLIISEAMDMYKSVMKQKGGGDYDNEALLGMQIGNSGPGIMNAIIFLILILFVIMLLFIALNKKNRPVYLKPKTKKKSPEKEVTTNPEKTDDAPILENASTIKQDDDTIRSELKSLRQTAVSLTVGEKESASNLIKEWLDDNPNKETDSEG